MFRPATQHTQSCDDHHPVMSITEGPLVTEIKQTFAPWATHTIRLTKGSPYVEVEWTAGPIPLEAATGKSLSGKELVIKFGSDIRSAGTFYTDSNGREVRTTQTKTFIPRVVYRYETRRFAKTGSGQIPSRPCQEKIENEGVFS